MLLGDLGRLSTAWNVVQDLLTPKLAALLEQCRLQDLDFDAAESLAMLVEDATVQQIMKVLLMYSDSLEAVCTLYRPVVKTQNPICGRWYACH